MPTYEELVSLIQNLNLQLKEALLTIEKLNADIVELKEKLNTNSSNSSIPPSQDPNRKTRKSKPSGRKQGGQPGHRRNTRIYIESTACEW